jgi:Uncharacterised nucleotidyltransferase
MKPIRPRDEVEVLLLCARAQRDEVALNRLRQLLEKNLDWDYLYKIAQRHGLIPLLYDRLRQADVAWGPADLLRRLKLNYQQNAARNQVLTNELLSLIAELQANGIESLPFKGPVLAVVAFGNPALRCFADLDLIVRQRDVAAARQILVARGYQPARNLDLRQERLLLESQHNIQFTHEEGRLIVELHWRVSADLFASSLSAEDLWANLETITLNEVAVRSLPAEELVFSLCVHGSRHLWEKLSWVCDVAMLVGADRMIDWTRLLERAEKANTERMLFLGLLLVRDLCGVSLPSDVNQHIAADRTVALLASRITARMLSGTAQVPIGVLEILKCNLLLRKSWAARARYFLFALSPSDDDLGSLALPRFLNFFYYGLRPLRLLQKRRRSSLGVQADQGTR